jgi:SagB-type dehydrogenase family enzyme
MKKEPQELDLSLDKIIKLPEPSYDSNTSVEKALLNRRSVRTYSNESLTLAEVSQLLWAAQGVTDSEGHRTAPSAIALYPIELYVVIGNVDGIESGVYRYIPNEHALLKIIEGDRRDELSIAAGKQSHIKNAAVDIVFSVVYEKETEKFGERGKRYSILEVGHSAQNVYLQAESLNLGTVVVGSFNDGKVKKVTGMLDNQSPLYIMPVGKKK